MSVAGRFAIAVHLLTLLDGEGERPSTSEWMSASIGVNAVVVRSVTGMLRRAGLVRTRQGVPGAHLALGIDEITLLDVYRAVESERDLFTIHNRPNPKCPVGAKIQCTLERFFGAAQNAMEQELAATTLAEVLHALKGPDVRPHAENLERRNE